METTKIDKQEIYWQNDCSLKEVDCPKCTEEINWNAYKKFPKYCMWCGVGLEWFGEEPNP